MQSSLPVVSLLNIEQDKSHRYTNLSSVNQDSVNQDSIYSNFKSKIFQISKSSFGAPASWPLIDTLGTVAVISHLHFTS